MPYIYTMILPFLTIASSEKKGRGVYCTEPIEKGTIIEIAPVIVLNPTERASVEKTILHDYIFEWGEDNKSAAVGLGYISMYNHSNQPNCAYQMDYDNQTISVITLSTISMGEELCINYMRAEGPSEDPVWFEQY